MCKRLLAVLFCLSAVTDTFAALDLTPVGNADWDAASAAHLMRRAGFGVSPEEARALATQPPDDVVRELVVGRTGEEPAFEHSGVFEAALDPFPPSRPATTALARAQGHALGVRVKPGGNRPLQPIVNKFFHWLRASRLETNRVSYWWAERMLTSEDPLRERLALFWHGHFATNEDKVRDYRKMLLQLHTLREKGRGNFRDLLIAMAQDPAMLVFLDAGVNTRERPNENFAREIMELFTLGVGHYGERDVQEAARAFTGWNVTGLEFAIDPNEHDAGEKAFLGHRGPFDGVELIDLILAEDQAADFIAAKLYRHFVDEDLEDENVRQLGSLLQDKGFEIGAFLETLFLSRDFYLAEHRGGRIKGPVELIVSTYRSMGLSTMPGVPDFNDATASLGQHLFHPPTVAGWSEGRSWITPSLMFERSNFALDALFPDIGFVPPDRYPFSEELVNVQDRLRQGLPVSAATRPTGLAEGATMAASNLTADRDEAFNTRLGSMRGWQMALERVRPIPRQPARIAMTPMISKAGLETPAAVVAFLERRFFAVALDEATRQALADFLEAELGTADVTAALSYAETPLRKLLHQMLSLPEYQLG